MRKFAALVLIAAACSGCSSRQHYVDHWLDLNFPVQYEEVHAGVESLVFADARTDTVGRAIRVPWMSFPWSDDEVQPALRDSYRAFIESEVRKHFVGGELFRFKVTVMTGVQRFVAHWFGEGEEVEFAMTLELYSAGDGRQLDTAFASIHIEGESFDSSAEAIESMYRAAISRCIAECIGDIEERNVFLSAVGQ